MHHFSLWHQYSGCHALVRAAVCWENNTMRQQGKKDVLSLVCQSSWACSQLHGAELQLTRLQLEFSFLIDLGSASQWCHWGWGYGHVLTSPYAFSSGLSSGDSRRPAPLVSLPALGEQRLCPQANWEVRYQVQGKTVFRTGLLHWSWFISSCSLGTSHVTNYFSAWAILSWDFFSFFFFAICSQ